MEHVYRSDLDLIVRSNPALVAQEGQFEGYRPLFHQTDSTGSDCRLAHGYSRGHLKSRPLQSMARRP